jgi:hyperosmotically inducible protein
MARTLRAATEEGLTMKISQLASLIVVGALVAPLAAQAQDKPASTTKMWVKDSVITTKIKSQLATSKPSSLAMVHVDTDADGWVQLT